MSYFSIITDPTYSQELKGIYEDITGEENKAPSLWFSSQGIRPDILSATWQMAKQTQLQGQLPSTVIQMITTTISVQNNCPYCTKAHTNALHGLGVSQDLIESCVSDPQLARIPQPYHSILKFALKVARTPDAVTDLDYQSLWDNGLSDEEILEVTLLASFTNFMNTWSSASGIPA